MTAVRLGRSDPCGKPQALARYAHAQKFLEVAELVESEARDGVDPASSSVAAALAVLAGIAASDAACCLSLKRRSRSDNHAQAAAFLRSISGGAKASTAFSDLISLKDTAHYGIINVLASDLKLAIRRAKTLVDFSQTLFDAL